MSLKTWILWVFVLLISGPASAQFYKYTDANGSIRYTDDFTQVPVNQRTKAKAFYESTTDTVNTNDTKEETQEGEKTPDQNAGVEVRQESPDIVVELEAMEKELAAKKSELDNESAALKKEKAELVKLQSRFVEKSHFEGRKFYNKKASEFRKKLTEYNKKRMEYNKELELFNAKQKKLNEEFQKTTQ